MNARKRLIQACRLTLQSLAGAGIKHDEASNVHSASDCFVCALRGALAAADAEDQSKTGRRTRKKEPVKLWEQ